MTHSALAPPSAGPPPENYERFFVPAVALPIAERLIRTAAPRPGERVLDVGCGTGIVARLAAEQVAPGGSVAGLDPNAGMLAVARAAAPPALGIAWHEAPAEAMPLPDAAFDVVLCQMTLQFIPDRAQALREMRRVLAAGGRVALNAPGPAAPQFEILAAAVARHLGAEAGGFVRAVFALHDEAELRTLLADAGFADPHTGAETHELLLPPPADFLRQYVWSTPLAMVIGGAGEELRAALEREVVAAWQPFAENGGMRLRQRVVTATATAPVRRG
jgi:ubiquinone/menaquinone biosynthesis C-methylase UbiE